MGDFFPDEGVDPGPRRLERLRHRTEHEGPDVPRRLEVDAVYLRKVLRGGVLLTLRVGWVHAVHNFLFTEQFGSGVGEVGRRRGGGGGVHGRGQR